MFPNNRIHQLSSFLANQIAAGEVIERPASAVKELLENSVDAGATHVFIEIEKSGKQLIRIRDNGSGIHPEDLILAVSAHATSKITHPSDLEKISSLGFRGEALASMAAVSAFRLVSALEGETAVEIRIAPHQKEIEMQPAAHPRGTTVEVRELFINTPARRRFLRSDPTEWAHIIDVVRKIALSCPALALTLIHNGSTVLQVPAAVEEKLNSLKRIQKILGKTLIEKMISVAEEAEGLSVEGFINAPEASAPHSDLQYFFLNGRCVRDKLILHALRSVAQDFLPLGRYAAYILHLNCDPSLVDVNVHPTKHEVRFQEPRLFHDFLRRALQRAWGEKREERAVPALTESNALLPTLSSHASSKGVSPVSALRRSIGLSHQRYLLTEVPEGLWVIDLLLLKTQEFKKLLSTVSQCSPLISKPLLWPVTIKLDVRQFEKLVASIIPWESLGIDFEAASDQEIIVRRLPVCLEQVDLQSLFGILSSDVNNSLESIAKAAAKASLKNLTQEEMETVLKEIKGDEEGDQTGNSFPGFKIPLGSN
jgi:DNA mismatch repair protein MutL